MEKNTTMQLFRCTETFRKEADELSRATGISKSELFRLGLELVREAHGNGKLSPQACQPVDPMATQNGPCKGKTKGGNQIEYHSPA